MRFKTFVVVNSLPYFLFTAFGLSNVLLEYFLGVEYKGVLTFLMSSYFWFPVVVLVLDFFLLKAVVPLWRRVFISLVSAMLFLVVGYALLFAFTSMRIELGLSI